VGRKREEIPIPPERRQVRNTTNPASRMSPRISWIWTFAPSRLISATSLEGSGREKRGSDLDWRTGGVHPGPANRSRQQVLSIWRFWDHFRKCAAFVVFRTIVAFGKPMGGMLRYENLPTKHYYPALEIFSQPATILGGPFGVRGRTPKPFGRVGDYQPLVRGTSIHF
jgi:hypothetical protein